MAVAQHTAASRADDPAGRWRALAAMALALAVLVAGYWPALASMAHEWWHSETFAHGLLVFPFSAWLVWRRRAELARTPLATDWRALPVVLALGAGWALASVADVLVVQQFAFVGLIAAVTWLVLGPRVVRTIAFPLGFLLLAVPVGTGLTEPLIDFTTWFLVRALELTGIPVYHEGNFLTIPSGRWNVVSGCSGLRYLMATVTVAVLFGYLHYRSVWRRVAFVVLGVAVAIVANGLRAYLIVMIAHLSDMRLALGVDHYIYGWVFYGIVIFLLLSLGMAWREPEAAAAASGGATAAGGQAEGATPVRPLGRGLVAALAALAAWPLLVAFGEQAGSAAGAIDAPAAPPGWQVAAAAPTRWTPHFAGAGALVSRGYLSDQGTVGVHLAWYPHQHQGAEVVSDANYLVREKHPVWKEVRHGTRRVAGGALAVRESVVSGAGQRLMVWHWYWVAGHHTASPYLAKLHEALGVLTGHGRAAAGVVLYAPFDGDPDAARARLDAFAAALLPALDARLAEASR